MRIGILTGSFLPKVGGAQVFSHNISRQLAKFGHDVDVYVPSDQFHALDPRYRALLTPLPWKFHGAVRRLSSLGMYRAARYLQRRQREKAYDVWLVVATYPSGYAGTTLRDYATIVLRASGEDIQRSPELGYGMRLNALQAARIKRTVTAYDKVVAMTQASRDDFRELGVADENIATITNGVDADWFHRDREVSELRSDLGWPSDRPVILTTGRNHHKKGFHLIPAIAERLRANGHEFRWYVVGLGTDRIDAEVRSRGLDSHVITIGQIGVSRGGYDDWRFPDRRLVRMYQAADVYAFPTLIENFPMVQLEAMAAGAAYVSTDAPGCRELVKHNENGLQARAGDVDSFALQMGRALSDQRLRERLVTKAFEFVASCTWEKVARRYEDLFQQARESRGSDRMPLEAEV